MENFREYYRVLKPGRWMTVVFHNSHNSVWNAIQEAMSSAGFVVADVRTLDKQQRSYRQATALWEKHEQPLELRTILDQNFVEESNGAWRVPDPKKESDLEQIRHRALLKEFQPALFILYFRSGVEGGQFATLGFET